MKLYNLCYYANKYEKQKKKKMLENCFFNFIFEYFKRSVS